MYSTSFLNRSVLGTSTVQFEAELGERLFGGSAQAAWLEQEVTLA